MHTVLQVDGHDRAALNQGRTCRRNGQSGSSPSCSCQCDISNREGWEMGANRYSHPQQRPEFTHSFHKNEGTCTPGRRGGHSHNQPPELSQSNEGTGGPSEPPLGLHNERTHVTSAGFLLKMCNLTGLEETIRQVQTEGQDRSQQPGLLKKDSDMGKSQREVNCSIEDITKSQSHAVQAF